MPQVRPREPGWGEVLLRVRGAAAAVVSGNGGGTKAVGWTVGLVVLGIGAVGAMAAFAFGSGSVEGQIQSRSKPFGTWSMTPTACYSGQHQSFFGVWVAPKVESSGGREGFKGGVKLMKSPTEEWNAYVESPLECESFKCKIWELPRFVVQGIRRGRPEDEQQHQRHLGRGGPRQARLHHARGRRPHRGPEVRRLPLKAQRRAMAWDNLPRRGEIPRWPTA